MMCPYCNQEMEAGYLKSSQFMRWGTERRLGYLPDDVKLNKQPLIGFFEGFFTKSFHCKSCH